MLETIEHGFGSPHLLKRWSKKGLSFEVITGYESGKVGQRAGRLLQACIESINN